MMYNAKSQQPMDGRAKKLRRIGNIKKDRFSDDGEIKLNTFPADFTLSEN